MSESKNKTYLYLGIAGVFIGIGLIFAIRNRRKVVKFSESLIGQTEVAGNMGFTNAEFQKLMEEVGWEPGDAWCVYFAKLTWYNMAPEFLKTKILNKVSGSSLQTWENLKDDPSFIVSTIPKAGDMAIWRKYDNGTATWNGHAGIVKRLGFGNFTTIEGNAQPMTSKILTPDGWKLMGDMQLYDEVICPDGSYNRVVGVYPQGERKIYKLTFSDGTITEASDNHLWKLHKFNGGSYILNTEQIIEREFNGNKVKRRLRMPRLQKFDFIQNYNQPINPYILGLLIGDGSISKNGVKITTNDKEILESFEQYYPECQLKKHKISDYQITFPDNKNNYITESLSQLNYVGLRSHEKYIPDCYKFTDFESRLALLQGLIDTDGHIDKYGRIEYTTVSEKLIRDVQSIVLSLGGRCKIQKRTNVKYTSPNQIIKKSARDAYRVAIMLPKGIEPCRLPRKLERYKPTNASIERSIKSIKYVGMKDCQCILVDHPDHLYITDNFIVTHNTSSLGSNEGYVVAEKTRALDFITKDGLRLLGFIRFA